MKIKCKCGKIATWMYMPSGELSEKDSYKCDNCVPRGCSCCWVPKDDIDVFDDIAMSNPENYYEELDNQGRKLPCCEWWYDEEGWEDE